jgi:hypothetical protein
VACRGGETFGCHFANQGQGGYRMASFFDFDDAALGFHMDFARCITMQSHAITAD